MQQTIYRPTWGYRFFIQPFKRDHEMYQRNGNPDPHASRDPRQPHTSLAYQDGRLRTDLDLPALLTAIYRVITIFSFGFLVITMRAERNDAKLGLTPQAIAQTIVQLSDDPTIKAAFLKLLTPETADSPAPPPKTTPMKGSGKSKAKPIGPSQPKGPGAMLRPGELIAPRDHEPPILSFNLLPLLQMRLPE